MHKILTFINLQVIAATNRIDILDPALLRSGMYTCIVRESRNTDFPMIYDNSRLILNIEEILF